MGKLSGYRMGLGGLAVVAAMLAPWGMTAPAQAGPAVTCSVATTGVYGYGSRFGSPAYAWGVAAVSCTGAAGANVALSSGVIHLEVSDLTTHRHAFGSNTTTAPGAQVLSSGRVVLSALVHGDSYQMSGSAQAVLPGRAPISINFRPAAHIIP
jgi:hypothetical protein